MQLSYYSGSNVRNTCTSIFILKRHVFIYDSCVFQSRSNAQDLVFILLNILSRILQHEPFWQKLLWLLCLSGCEKFNASLPPASHFNQKSYHPGTALFNTTLLAAVFRTLSPTIFTNISNHADGIHSSNSLVSKSTDIDLIEVKGVHHTGNKA